MGEKSRRAVLSLPVFFPLGPRSGTACALSEAELPAEALGGKNNVSHYFLRVTSDVAVGLRGFPCRGRADSHSADTCRDLDCCAFVRRPPGGLTKPGFNRARIRTQRYRPC